MTTKPCYNFAPRGAILPSSERTASLQERARVRDDARILILREEEAIAVPSSSTD